MKICIAVESWDLAAAILDASSIPLTAIGVGDRGRGISAEIYGYMEKFDLVILWFAKDVSALRMVSKKLTNVYVLFRTPCVDGRTFDVFSMDRDTLNAVLIELVRRAFRQSPLFAKQDLEISIPDRILNASICLSDQPMPRASSDAIAEFMRIALIQE